MSAVAFQITGVSMVCSTVCSGADQRKHQSSASLALMRRIHQWLVNTPHNRPVKWNMFPFDDIIMWNPSSSRTRISVSCLVNHMAADDLAGGQGSSSHGIDWVSLDYSGFNTRALSQHKDHLSWNGYFNYKDKMVMRPSYLYKGNPILVRQHLYIEMVPWGACY